MSGALSWLRENTSWAPDWMVAIAIIALALVFALILHALLVAIFRRIVSPQRVFVRLLLGRTRGPTQLALLVLALAGALRWVPLDPVQSATLNQVLTIAFVVLLGWIALIAIDLATGVYLRRFQLDSEDNLLARKHVTQVRILKRSVDTLAVVITVSLALMTFEPVRQYGISLFASAGVAGIVAGLAARPVLSNLLAGVQIAMTQPIRLEDAVTVEGEFGWIEEITSTYVVLRLWDLRRMIVPLSYFMEKPFQNWTRQSSALIGSVFLYLDYTAPVERIREKLSEIAKNSNLWDGKVANLQVSDCKTSTIELRALVSARDSGALWNLRCQVREQLIAFLQQQFPNALPRQRTAVELPPDTLSEQKPQRAD
ncbi:MAG: mechanosensitive ion channel family protein [Bradyrhizobiaceae bacterium]|nr:mechanosensitive ion channel family protein [Bradyrhizobiaceae bacterium]